MMSLTSGRRRRTHLGRPMNKNCTPRLALISTVAFLLMSTPVCVASAADCPNQEARERDNSTLLVDCRAYERVSPLEKNGGDISSINETNEGGVIQAAPDGSKITYPSLSSFGEDSQGAGSGSQYLSTREGGGWNTENITARLHAPRLTNVLGTAYKAFNLDLTEGVLLNTTLEFEESDEPSVGGAPAGYREYYVHNFSNNADQALVTTPPEPAELFNIESQLNVIGDFVTPDLNHIILASAAALVPGVTLEGTNLYEWAHGQLMPVNILPGATGQETLPGARLGSERGLQSHTVSDDGSRVFWSNGGGAEALYAREGIGTSQPKTIRVDAGIGGGGLFLVASTDGAKVFFTKGNQGTGDLYEYDLENETLADLTATEPTGEAMVQGVLGASVDGDYVYFVARGALAPGAVPETCEATNAATGCNLYLWHAGSGLTFVARLAGSDEEGGEAATQLHDWSEYFTLRTTRVSPDGHHLVFMSGARLTPSNNAGTREVYEYDSVAERLDCVSCNPRGLSPVGVSSIPGATPYRPNSAAYESRVVTDDGSRVFFDSGDGLSDDDTNGKQDVYEWERAGAGTCVRAGGCVSLVSSGVGSGAANFVDSSANGSDVFFTTRQQLTPGDVDHQVDLYDARENGGYTVADLPVCAGTGCQGVPNVPPIFATPPTVTFSGVGNFPAPRGPGVVRPRKLTRAQKLAKALKLCAKRPRRQRPPCRRSARHKYGPKQRASTA